MTSGNFEPFRQLSRFRASSSFEIHALESRQLLSVTFDHARAAAASDSASGSTSITTTVSGTAGPWESGPSYGVGDESSPTAIDASSGLPFQPGSTLDIQYVSGQVSAGPPDWPFVDANGDTSASADATGSSGTDFPAYYFTPAEQHANLVELVGVFTDASGNFVGGPYTIGDSRTLTIPDGATQLQLGVNDDIFRDNVGSWQLKITENDGLTVSVDDAKIVPTAEPILHLNHFFGGERVNVPIALQNLSTDKLQGNYNLSLSLSTTEDFDESDVFGTAEKYVDLDSLESKDYMLEGVIPSNARFSGLQSSSDYYVIAKAVPVGAMTKSCGW